MSHENSDHEDCDSNEEDGESYESDEGPPYSVEQITGCIREFYEFLTTLHFSPDDLLIPPESGWEHIPDSGDDTSAKSPLVLSVLKHLPFFKDTAPAQIHYKSRIRDYSNVVVDDLSSNYQDELFEDFLRNAYPDESDEEADDNDDENEAKGRNTTTPKDIIVIADGHESGGRTIALVPKTGDIIEDVIGFQDMGPFDIFDYFSELKEKYRNLQLIGGVGKNVIEADRVPETSAVLTPKNLSRPTREQGLDPHDQIQHLRQIFRNHGWPDSFRREEAMDEVNKWLKENERENEWNWQDDFML